MFWICLLPLFNKALKCTCIHPQPSICDKSEEVNTQYIFQNSSCFGFCSTAVTALITNVTILLSPEFYAAPPPPPQAVPFDHQYQSSFFSLRPFLQGLCMGFFFFFNLAIIKACLLVANSQKSCCLFVIFIIVHFLKYSNS